MNTEPQTKSGEKKKRLFNGRELERFFAGNPKILREKKIHYIVFFFFWERFAGKREKIKKQRLKENETMLFSFFLFIYYLPIFTFF